MPLYQDRGEPELPQLRVYKISFDPWSFKVHRGIEQQAREAFHLKPRGYYWDKFSLEVAESGLQFEPIWPVEKLTPIFKHIMDLGREQGQIRRSASKLNIVRNVLEQEIVLYNICQTD